MTVPDNFSRQADYYARFRPVYPPELYEFILKNCPGRELALDCATGNGQAARELARHFHKVVAQDISAAQIQRAPSAGNIEYATAPAEDTGLADESADLITVAQALHWFKTRDFFKEALRVLRPGGILAAWGYHRHLLEGEVGRLFNAVHFELLGDYWAPEIQLLLDRYRGLSFPFDEIQAPGFYFQSEPDFHELRGYIFSWSAAQKFIQENSREKLEEALKTLEKAWGAPENRKIMQWELFMRIGRKPQRAGPAG